MKTLVSGVFLSLTFTGLVAQTQPAPKKHNQTVSAELQAEVDRIDQRLQKADSLYQLKLNNLNLVLQKLGEESKHNREMIAEFEKEKTRLKEEYRANMKALGIQVKLD
jgi:hypothetical protein